MYFCFFPALMSALYTIPAAIAAMCFAYEHAHLPIWMIQWQEVVCRHPDLSGRWQVPCSLPDGQAPEVARPQVPIF
jgi:hypothetical protein